MSKSSKIVLGIVIIIAIGLIAWCFFGTTSPVLQPVTAPVAYQSVQTNQPQAATVSNTPVSGLTTSSSDDSDAALNSDMSVISTQSAAMDQDSSAANNGSSSAQ
jgi:hypothetical protein